MRKIKNSAGKTICRLDAKDKLVEILHKGVKTIIKFQPNGSVEVIDLGQKQE